MNRRHIPLGLLAVSRAIIFPDFSNMYGIWVIHLLPVLFAYLSWRQFKSPWAGLFYVLVAEVLGLGIYAISGGIEYMLGADHTPYLAAYSLAAQLLAFFVTYAFIKIYDLAKAQ